jgi:hypothetical protein
VFLQNCWGLKKDEPDCGSEARATILDDGTEVGNLKVEESNMEIEETIDIKEENLEELTSPTMEAEPEVSVRSCV